MSETTTASAKPGKKTYRGSQRPTWCAGCGDYSVLAALDRALLAYGRPEEEITIVSGIGCSSRFPFFMNTYGFHSVHGRALAVATGLKLARPDITVIATGGDGDALAIGGNHFFHAMRRNVDITYILMDNQIYGMTKGQVAPTSELGMKTKSTPYGAFEPPVEPIWAALTMGATFVAQTASHDPNHMTEMFLLGLRHRGMSFINCLSPCVTFNPSMDRDYYKAHTRPLPEGYDPSDYEAALKLAFQAKCERFFPMGVIYVRQEPTLADRVGEIREKALKKSEHQASIEEIVREFL
ncbi:MAG: 2-oxoacid:ferredoxin oxidoreductase subunit beta [Candidatus Sumerlaeaceae bacterium]